MTGQDPPDEPRSWQYLGLTWNEADLKSVIITVGGTIAGGLVLVMIVGLALALAHYETQMHNPTWSFAVVAAVFLTAAPFFYVANRTLGISRRWNVVPALCLVAGLIALLVLIGDAAGIK